MRGLADAERIRRFLTALGEAATTPAHLYLVGGATAVLRGWRPATIDIDLEIVPESDELLRAVARLKESLGVNVELAAPHHFVPELPGWRERSLFVGRFGHLSVLHYDPYSQALSKIERGHAQDREDVARMLGEGLVEPGRLRELFAAVESQLHRYPAISPQALRAAVEDVLSGVGDD